MKVNIATVGQIGKAGFTSAHYWSARVYSMDGRLYEDVVAASLVELVQKLVNGSHGWHSVE